MLRRLRTPTVLLPLAFAAACGATTPTDPPGNNGGNNNGGATSTGSLEVTVGGLAAGVDAALTVTGPDGFSQTVTASETLTDLATGSYTVAAAGVSGGAITYAPAQSSQTVAVQADQSTLVVVDYVAQLGALDVLISGLPLGADPDVEVTGPAGYAQSLVASTLLSDLPVGDYTVTAAVVTSAGGDGYHPSPATQTVSVPVDEAPAASVQYMLAATSLQVVVSGLPGGVDAAIEVSGPGGYSATVTATETLAGLAAGDYTLEATAVLDGASAYVPDPFAPTVLSISGGDAESTAVTYTLLTLLANYDRLAIGATHGCGIDADGAVNCWGTGNQGQLGTGIESDQQLDPVGAAAGPYVQVVTGDAFTCARTTAGQADCWGSNIYGAVGTGATPIGPLSDPVLDPTPVAGGHTFVQISTSGHNSHTCGLDSMGQAWCWGRGDSGQLGNGSTTDTSTPQMVSGGHTFVDIAAGLYVTTCALDDSGKVWCWGGNSGGALGVSDGVLTMSTTPVEMTADMTFARLAEGGAPCALTAVGQAYCWSDAFWFGSLNHNPVLMAGGRAFVQIVAGPTHVCGLEPGGAAWCWGDNGLGRLGNPTAGGGPTAVEVAGGHTFVALAPGSAQACGIDAGGTRWCWGANFSGELGIGVAGDPVMTPTQLVPF